MWLKRTTEEIAEVKRKQHVSRVRESVLAGLFLLLLTFLCFGVYEAARRGRILVPADEIINRLPMALFFGLIMTLVYFKFDTKRPMRICPKSEATKHDDGCLECSCGGRFEDMDEMKWTKDPTQKL